MAIQEREGNQGHRSESGKGTKGIETDLKLPHVLLDDGKGTCNAVGIEDGGPDGLS